jgi:hypothetical protein
MTGHPGAPYFSTMYFGGVGNVAAGEAAAAVREYWDGIKGFINSGLQIQVQPEQEDVDPVTGNILDEYTNVQAVVAATGNAPLPFSTQGLHRWRTNTFIGGKRIAGRTFIPNLANDAQLNAVPSAGFLAALNTEGGILLAAGGPTNQFGVWSRKNGSFHEATSQSPWTNFAVLRSRRD